ncbi:hypothetical protein [Pyrodictium abyssi]
MRGLMPPSVLPAGAPLTLPPRRLCALLPGVPVREVATRDNLEKLGERVEERIEEVGRG